MLDAVEKSNALSVEQIAQIRANVSKISEEVELLRKQAATEVERRLLTAAETTLRKSTVDKTEQEIKNLATLLPFEQALKAAQTEQSKASAAAQLMRAAYDKKLIDSGYIEAMVRDQNSSAGEKEVRAKSENYEYLLRSGDIFDTSTFAGDTAKDFVQAASIFSKVISGFFGFFK